jgi:hypothetical protein
VGNGRPKGSRVRLSEAFLADLNAEWKKSGKSVLRRVAQSAPETFLRVIATVLPKALEVDSRVTLTQRTELAVEIADFAAAYEQWGKVVGAQMPMIEAEVVEDDDAGEQS